jgi:gluconate kinase
MPWTNQLSSWSPARKTEYSTEASSLKSLKDELLAGNPVIVHVYTSRNASHYVTVFAIRSGANMNNLVRSDFRIIDPWGGDEKALTYYTSDFAHGDSTEWQYKF